ncbi:MAG: type II toxin-antitoxin system VapC family toxin [Candidatus Bathyarchaeia archaeon]
MSYVIDASVAAKLFIVEDDSDKAVELVDAHAKGYLSLSAPTLIVYELGNVFWKHPQITPERAHAFIKRFLNLQISLQNVYLDDDLLRSACELSESRGVTFYDASYMAMTERNRIKMLTADEEIHDKAPDITVLLKEFRV